MSRSVLSWAVYTRPSLNASAICIASGSDPLKPDESPVARLMQLIYDWTGHTVIPEETGPQKWAWYGDHGADNTTTGWSIFGECTTFD